MRDKIGLNRPDREELNYSCPITSFGTADTNPALENIVAGTDKDLFETAKKSLPFKNSVLNAIISVFSYSGFAIKVIVLFSFSAAYFVLGAVGVALYVVFYEKLFKTIFNTAGKKNHKSPYYYKWKKHHLELNYEA